MCEGSWAAAGDLCETPQSSKRAWALFSVSAEACTASSCTASSCTALWRLRRFQRHLSSLIMGSLINPSGASSDISSTTSGRRKQVPISKMGNWEDVWASVDLWLVETGVLSKRTFLLLKIQHQQRLLEQMTAVLEQFIIHRPPVTSGVSLRRTCCWSPQDPPSLSFPDPSENPRSERCRLCFLHLHSFASFPKGKQHNPLIPTSELIHTNGSSSPPEPREMYWWLCCSSMTLRSKVVH